MCQSMKLDPEIAKGIALFPALDLRDVNAARAIRTRMREAANIPRLTDDRIIEVEKIIPGPDSESTIPIRIYTPKEQEGFLPCLVFFHGGGFVMGDLESTHPRCLRLSSDGGSIVVSVDYRLAPEYPFPAGIEDCFTALQWTAEHAGAIGVDPQQLAVGGVSAGGCLAAGVALMARDREGPSIGFQLLIYPVLDDRLSTSSMRNGADYPIWNSRNCRDMWHHYLGDSKEVVSPYAAPARAKSLSKLPPAYIAIAEYDPLRDEALQYAMRLLKSGVPVELHQYAGTVHGFDGLLPSHVSVQAANELVTVFRRFISNYT
jgi:acetyl esterase/lipase